MNSLTWRKKKNKNLIEKEKKNLIEKEKEILLSKTTKQNWKEFNQKSNKFKADSRTSKMKKYNSMRRAKNLLPSKIKGEFSERN